MMEDWDVDLLDAIEAAKKAAATTAHLCHAGPLQPRQGASFQRVIERDGTAAGHCHLDGQPESCRQLVQEMPGAAFAAMGTGVEQ